MRTTFTPAVTRAIEVAQRAAVAEHSDFVRGTHLVRGLLAEEEGRAAEVVQAAGLDLEAFRGGWTPPDVDLAAAPPLSPLCHTAIDLGRDLALEWTGESTLSSEALLLALLRSDAELARSLAKKGLSLDHFEALFATGKAPVPRLEEPLRLADLTERVDLARILDVGFNRAREALRILEDYCRFALADAFLSRQVKELRHDLVAAVEERTPPGLLEARDTLRDVGTDIRTDSEGTRASLADVVQVNLKRLQEALRSLEEFGKVASPLLGELMEQMRYRAYTLERALILGTAARHTLREVRLCVLLGGSACVAALDWTIAEAAAGGAKMVQLREKHLSDRALLDRARRVRQWTRQAGVLFIVNDRPDIARLAGADGVHLGQDDLSVHDARRVVGPEALIGVSTHSLEQVEQAVLDGASYLGVGPVFPSGTKSFAAFPGLDFVQAALARTSLPAFAIGGINADTIPAVAAAGIRRIAVSQAIAQADDPRSAAAVLLAALEEP